MRRLWMIITLTAREILAAKLIPVCMLLFGLFFLSLSSIKIFEPQEQVRFSLDLSITFFSFFLFLMAIFGPLVIFDISDKASSINFLLSKPVKRNEILLGRILGLVGILALTFLMMAVSMIALLQVQIDFPTVSLIAVLYLLIVKYSLFLMIVSLLSLFLDRLMTLFASAFVFFFATAFSAVETLSFRSGTGWMASFAHFGKVILPPFEALSRVDILTGEASLSAAYLAQATLASLAYGVAVFLLAGLFFSRKEA